MLVQVVSSPLVPKVAKLIEQRLGRKLEPYDIWYNGFRAQSSNSQEDLDKIVSQKYPTPAAFEKDIPNILMKLGFPAERAAYIAKYIAVDPARGSGHASGGGMRGATAHLRTRLGKNGMDYKGFNIAVHELGHNVEQVLSLNDVDYALLQGVPNTAFTEGFAFVFQARDLEILGLDAKRDERAAALKTLNDFWGAYEISAVSLVDMEVWRWMYEHPEATPAELKNAVIGISIDMWNTYFAPVFKNERRYSARHLFAHDRFVPLSARLPDRTSHRQSDRGAHGRGRQRRAGVRANGDVRERRARSLDEERDRFAGRGGGAPRRGREGSHRRSKQGVRSNGMGTHTARRVLVTGALGQIGSELTLGLKDRYGADNVIATDIQPDTKKKLSGDVPFALLDVLKIEMVEAIVEKYRVNTIYHLAALLSAVAETKAARRMGHQHERPSQRARRARANKCSLFFPSSIGAFGPSTPPDGTPQDTIQRPESMYGVTKVAGELLCDYYFKRFGVDTRGVRFPGIISNGTLPGGGTTDYAVEIFYAAIKERKYTCFLKQGTSLDMMYMPDAIKAAIGVMEADPARLNHRNSFNVTAMHFTPEMLAAEIQKHIKEFSMDYRVDPMRQRIADSWPNYMDDGAAREEWGWTPDFDLAAMTADMIRVLGARHEQGLLV